MSTKEKVFCPKCKKEMIPEGFKSNYRFVCRPCKTKVEQMTLF